VWASGRGAGEELTRHPEVNHQPAAPVQARQQVLPAPPQLFHGAPGETPSQAGRRGEEELAGAGGVGGADAAPDQQGLDLPPRYLDLRELRHGCLTLAQSPSSSPG
jgi:hypothetical protein